MVNLKSFLIKFLKELAKNQAILINLVLILFQHKILNTNFKLPFPIALSPEFSYLILENLIRSVI